MANRIDINTATVEDLEQLTSIGRLKAEAIVKHRKSIGGFKFVRDLSKVPGVGSSVLDLNRRRLYCSTSRRTYRKKTRNEKPHGRSTRAVTVKGPDGPAHNLRHNGEGRRGRSAGVNVRPRAGMQKHESQKGGNKESVKDGEKDREKQTGCQNTAAQPSTSTGETAKTVTSKCSSINSNNGSINSNSDSINSNNGSDSDLEEDTERDSESPVGDGEEAQHAGSAEVGGRLADSDTDDSTSEMSTSDSPSSQTTPRSKIPVLMSKVLGKQMMKRKGISFREELSLPNKRVCRSDLPSPQTTYSNLKGPFRKGIYHRQRIPSKEHPPHGLADWLKQFQDWGNAERLMAIDELITLCEPTQVRHMMQVIEPQFQRDFISLLPKELALYVLSFLDPKDLLQAAQTCRYWRVLAEDNLLWREKCREDNIDEALVFGTNRQRRRQLSPKSPWKALFMRQHQIEQNWRSRPIRPPKVLKGHDDHVITCLEFCGSRVVSGSDDNTLKVWSAINGKCLRTLVGHTGGVWSSQMQGNTIISGSTDRTLKVWNADTGQCIHTLYGHTSTVRCMHLHDSKVVSGSRDATLRVWNIDTGQCLHVLMGHVAAVRCVQYDGRRVVSGAYDYMVKVWDPDTETCLHTLQGHTNRVYSLQFDGVHIVSGSLDTSIRVWDVETGNCLHTLIGHQSLTSGLELKDNILVSGNADSTVKVWDITTGQCLQTLQGSNKHQSAVTCLQFNKKMVITSSDDGTVKIWDLKSGDFLRNLVSLDSGGSGGVVWRVRCNNTKLICAVGSRNGTEETKLLVLDFDVEDKKEIGLGKEKLPITA